MSTWTPNAESTPSNPSDDWRRGRRHDGGDTEDGGEQPGSSGPILTDVDVSYAVGFENQGPTCESDVPQSRAGLFSESQANSPNGASAGAGTSGSSSGGTTTVNGANTGSFVINVTYDQAESSLPAGFVAAINYVVSYYESVFSNPVTVNIDVGYGEIDGQSLSSGALGESETYVDNVSYSQAVAALQANETSTAQQQAYGSLPVTSPFGNDSLWLATAEEKALGLISGSDSDIDGYAAFSDVYPFNYSAGGTPPSSEYDFIGVVEHEFSEVMGRDSFLGDGIGGTTSYSVMDLFRYSAPNQRDLTKKPPVANTAYFSINNGTTDLDNWNTNTSGDLGDWASTAGADAYLAFSPSGQTNAVTPTDLEVMNVLGWNPSTGNSSSAGSVQVVLPGQTSSGLSVTGGEVLDVDAGGTSIDMFVADGGTLNVFGLDVSATIGSGGSEIVSSGGTASAMRVGSGGTAFVLVGGTASGTTVSSAGEQYVGSAGTTLSVLVDSGGIEVLFGAGSGAAVDGTQYDFSVALGGTTYDGGLQQVALAGAVASGMTVAFGGEQYIGSGGTALATRTASGGAEVVFGFDSGALISGTQYDFGAASGGAVYGAGFQWVAPGGIATGLMVESGGEQYIGIGGTALFTDIGAYGAEVVFGSDGGALVSGTQYVFGVASGGTTFDGGSQQVEPGGTAIGMTVSLGGEQYVGVGGTVIDTTVMGEAAEIVHGTDFGATISGTQYVYGSASGTVVGAGGYQLVSSGGSISAANISGGSIELTSGASNGNAPITFAGAGELILDASASFSGTVAGFGSASLDDTIDFADIPYLGSGATATTVSWSQLTSGANASGTLMVAQGGHAADITLLGQYLAGNFSASGDGHGGTLVIDPPVTAAAGPNLLVPGNTQHG